MGNLWYGFQSLIGSIGNCNSFSIEEARKAGFQSLIGSIGNCNHAVEYFIDNEGVSIPNREYWKLQSKSVMQYFLSLVSIPNREYWKLQLR